MDKIKKHFEAEAQEFDAIIRRLIPYYPQMLEAVMVALPFEPSQAINVIDLGCGTGTMAQLVKSVYPKASLTCVDLAENMLAMAQAKLGAESEVRYQLANFESYEFDASYDAILSSLALHHLVSDADKISFYTRVYQGLKPNGVFYNADVVLGPSAFLQRQYMAQWRKFMRRQVSDEEIEQKWIPKYYEEDRPAILRDQLAWLQEIGFVEVEVIWKYYNFAVYGGSKAAAV